MKSSLIHHKTFGALANEYRFKIVELLSKRGALCPTQINKIFFMSQSTCSHHIGILRKHGFLTSTKIGKYSVYSLNKKMFRELKDYIEGVASFMLTENASLSVVSVNTPESVDIKAGTGRIED